MNVLCVCATSGRHYQLEIVVRCFLKQDYSGQSILLIFNNSQTEQKLDNISLPENKKIILVNSLKNSVTHLPYTSVGEIFNDCLYWIKNNIDIEWLENSIINHYDCDDIFLPHHLSLGVKGYLKGTESGNTAYKPRRSYFMNGNSLSLEENTLEPSIFLSWNQLLRSGYYMGNADYNCKWVEESKIYMDEAKPSFCYVWGNNTYKISGNDKDPNNFQNARANDTQEGDRLISPAPIEVVNKIYEKVKLWQK